jgi:undecaprenyl-diphosphatase
MLGSALLYLVVGHFFVHTHVAATVARAAEIGAPSTQSLSSFVGYGTIGYMLVLLIWRRPAATFIVSATFLLVLAISFGRLYTGERYFSDVVSGLAAGGVWLSACITGLEVARRRRERDRRIGPGRL